MKRLSATAATIALAASLMLTPPVGAGGSATVSVVGPSMAPTVGVPWPLELEVLQHGVTPIHGERVSLVARNQASGMVTSANARPGDAVGRYLAEVVFPDAGDWTLEFGLRELELILGKPSTIIVGASPTAGAGDLATLGVDGPDCG